MAGLSIAEMLRQELTSYPPLQPILTGGVWTRPIKRDMSEDAGDPSLGSTPGAFEATPPYRIKPCISIQAGLEERNSNAPNDAMWGFPTLWIRTQPKTTEKAKLEDIFLLIRRRLHHQPLTMPSGSGCMMALAGRMGPMDDIAIKGAVVMMVTVQVDGIWEVL